MIEKIILASKSPRRQELIRGLELAFDIFLYETDESFPSHLRAGDIAAYLSEKKARAFTGTIGKNEVLLTADTIVWVNGHVLNKPADEADSKRMLKEICGTTHEVFTGVTLTRIKNGEPVYHTFTERTSVTCKALSDEDILHYIIHYRPFDKAGSYGIQDWFGYTAVERIEGCFYNVMGLPVSRLYAELRGLS